MKLLQTIYMMLLSLILSSTVMAGDISAELDKVLQGSQREAKNVARDV